jgi:hypothetical protein
MIGLMQLNRKTAAWDLKLSFLEYLLKNCSSFTLALLLRKSYQERPTIYFKYLTTSVTDAELYKWVVIDIYL